jgi:hypothetical protein
MVFAWEIDVSTVVISKLHPNRIWRNTAILTAIMDSSGKDQAGIRASSRLERSPASFFSHTRMNDKG